MCVLGTSKKVPGRLCVTRCPSHTAGTACRSVPSVSLHKSTATVTRIFIFCGLWSVDCDGCGYPPDRGERKVRKHQGLDSTPVRLKQRDTF